MSLTILILKLQLQFFAHKMGQGSTKNGRDSIGRRLGQKLSDGQSDKSDNSIEIDDEFSMEEEY